MFNILEGVGHFLPKGLTLGFIQSGNVFGHEASARVGGQHFFMLVKKPPVQRGEWVNAAVPVVWRFVSNAIDSSQRPPFAWLLT